MKPLQRLLEIEESETPTFYMDRDRLESLILSHRGITAIASRPSKASSPCPCRSIEYYLNGAGNGAVRNYFKSSGQCQETGRDQGHTQMGFDYLACTCEIAWNQGIDLYGAFVNRLPWSER